MRVLITTPSAWGHLQPMVPLAKALQARGHELRWATGADSSDWLAGVGVPPVSAGIRQQDLLTARSSMLADVRGLPREDIPDVLFARIFGGIAAPAMLHDLAPLVAEWTPDLVIHDAAELAGPIIAAKIGVPSVTKSFGILLPEKRVSSAGDRVADLWRSYGLQPRRFGGCYEHLYLDMAPATLQPTPPDYIPRRQPLRPESHVNVAAEWSEDSSSDWPPGFPAVYLTMGTVFNDPSVLRSTVDSVAKLGVDLLVTVGPRVDPADLGDQPPHVRVERYVPQTSVLKRCRVVVSHAGSGTAFATLSQGLPQLCLPQGADQFLNADAIAQAGAGLSLRPDAASGPAIAGRVDRLLNEPQFRSSAQAIAAEIAQMPDADEVATVLERLP